ncbi:MAG: tetratricopeptide repeat protein [Thermoplasmatota archaeon]
MDEDYDLHVEAVQQLKKAMVLYEEQLYSEMAGPLERCLELDDSLGDAWELYGLAALAAMDPENARYCFERAESSRGSHTDASLALGIMRSPSWPEGKELLDRVNGLAALGQVYLSNSRWRAAGLCFATVSPHIEPGYRIWSILGLIYRELGLLEVSLEHYERASAMEDAPFELLHDKSIVLIKMGRFVEAERLIGYLLDVLEDDPQLWNNLGAVLEAQGKDDDALEAYDKALDLDDGYYPALYSKGRILQKKGKMEEARPFMEKALGIEGRVYDLDDVTGSEMRSGDGQVHVKEVSARRSKRSTE